MRSWAPTTQGGVAVRSERGEYEADRLVLCVGAWAGKVVPSLASLARPERQVLAWFQPSAPDLFSPDRFHPSALGYKRTAKAMLPSVLAALGVEERVPFGHRAPEPPAPADG